MRIAFAIVCLMWAMTATADQQPSVRGGDEAAVKELVAQYNAAPDQEDPGAIRSLFTADADQLVSSGNGGAGAAMRQMWSTFLAVRTADGWRLTAIRNMLPAR